MKQEQKVLSLREFRERFCKSMSFIVLKKAYENYCQGVEPQRAVTAAIAACPEQCKSGNLREHCLVVEKELNAVNVFVLRTETRAAQNEIFRNEWDFHNIELCTARLGEKYDCKVQTTLDFPSNLIIGVYEHRHRYAAVISIEPEQESAIAVPKIKKLAQLLALNALADYTVYLHEKRYREWARKHPKRQQVTPELPDFIDFLCEQPLHFAPEINKENSMFYDPKRAVTIAAYLERFGKELGFKLTLASADVFGDFSHL